MRIYNERSLFTSWGTQKYYNIINKHGAGLKRKSAFNYLLFPRNNFLLHLLYILFPSVAYLLIRIIFIFLETSGTVWQTQIVGQRRGGGGGKMKSDGIPQSCHRSLQKGNEEWQEKKESKE